MGKVKMAKGLDLNMLGGGGGGGGKSDDDAASAGSVSRQDSASASGTVSTSLKMTELSSISNGLCRFNPTSKKGKWIFLAQTVLLSFTPIAILLVQNGIMFSEMLVRKDVVLQKDAKVRELQALATLVLDLQKERAAIALNTYTAIMTGDSMDLTPLFTTTDRTLTRVFS